MDVAVLVDMLFDQKVKDLVNERVKDLLGPFDAATTRTCKLVGSQYSKIAAMEQQIRVLKDQVAALTMQVSELESAPATQKLPEKPPLKRKRRNANASRTVKKSKHTFFDTPSQDTQ